MYTQVVMFRTGSRPSDEKKGGGGGGGDHPVLEIRRGGGRSPASPESATDVQSPSSGVPRIGATTSFTEKKTRSTDPTPAGADRTHDLCMAMQSSALLTKLILPRLY